MYDIYIWYIWYDNIYLIYMIKMIISSSSIINALPFSFGLLGNFLWNDDVMFSGFEFLCFDILTLTVLWSGFWGGFFLKDLVQIKVLVNMHIQISKCVFVCSGVPSRTRCVFCEIRIHTRLTLAGKHCMCLILRETRHPSFIKFSPVFFLFPEVSRHVGAWRC